MTASVVYSHEDDKKLENKYGDVKYCKGESVDLGILADGEWPFRMEAMTERLL